MERKDLRTEQMQRTLNDIFLNNKASEGLADIMQEMLSECDMEGCPDWCKNKMLMEALMVAVQQLSKYSQQETDNLSEKLKLESPTKGVPFMAPAGKAAH